MYLKANQFLVKHLEYFGKCIVSISCRTSARSCIHICVEFILTASHRRPVLRQAVEFLSNEGHIFSTIDEDHYKSTDGDE